MNEKQKTIVITGASRGLGLALANELVRTGYVVKGCSRSAGRARGLGFALQSVDICDEGQVGKWAAAILEQGCIPDILICNAAVINEPAPLWKVPGAELRDVITTNVIGTSFTIQVFAPAMIKRGNGLIVAMSSGWGRGTEAGMAPYCASKSAVEALTMSLAKELPPGVAAVTLNPGVVRTDMLHKCWPETWQDYESPEAWAKRAAKFILGISVADNGTQLSVPAA